MLKKKKTKQTLFCAPGDFRTTGVHHIQNLRTKTMDHQKHFSQIMWNLDLNFPEKIRSKICIENMIHQLNQKNKTKR